MGFVGVTVFCLAIALLLFGLEVTSPFVDTLVISLCIGYGISCVSYVMAPALERYLSQRVLAVTLTPLGLLLGLVVAGLINHGEAVAYLAPGAGALILGAFFAVVGYLLFEARSRLVTANAQLADAKLRQQEQEKALVTAELRRLQAQIEPHFLFNTLSNIVGLVHTDPDAAEQTLLHLTTLLRSSLDRTRKTQSTLGQELSIIRAYLAIHEIRMPNRLQVKFDPDLSELPDPIINWPMPPLLLQPLVENAIAHGIDPLEEGGEVSITIRLVDDQLQVAVADTGCGNALQVSPSGGNGNGTGIENVRSRLKALYEDAASLEFVPNQPRGVCVLLTLSNLSTSGAVGGQW